MGHVKVPKLPTIRRLPTYLYKLSEMRKAGVSIVATPELARYMNLGEIVIRKDLAARTNEAVVPTMLRYSTYIENDSMFNTPPTFAIYMLALVTDWIKEQGGLTAMEKINNEKAAYLYDFLDNSTFYKSPVAKADRSIMNVVFRTPSEELDAAFVKEAKENGLTELKGHRLVGGCRASIYNAMPLEGVKALVEFMKKFELANK